MAFSVRVKGRLVTVETLDDLDALLERYPESGEDEAVHSSQKHGKPSIDGRWPMSRFKDFTGRLTPPLLRMLQEVVKSQHGKTARDLAQILGFRDAKVFGPLMAAMSKHAKKTGVRVQDVLVTDRIDVGDGEKVTQFKATDSFARAAIEAGWSRGV